MVAVESFFRLAGAAGYDGAACDGECAVGINAVVVAGVAVSLSAVYDDLFGGINAVVVGLHVEQSAVDGQNVFALWQM